MTNSKNIKEKFIFFDRDGTIVKDKEYMYQKKEIEFLPGVVVGLKQLQFMGYQFIIITNQSGIARGFYSLEDAMRFNQHLAGELRKKGIEIKKIYLCPHHPNFTGKCFCRKPEIGLAKIAQKEYKIDLVQSIFVGDQDCDIELGKNCGGTTFLIKNNQYKTSAKPDHIVTNISEIAEIIRA